MSRVVRFSVTKRPASGTHTRRVWMLRFCHLFVLMFECETFCARTFRLPVMSLFAMATLASLFRAAEPLGGTEGDGTAGFCQGGSDVLLGAPCRWRSG